MLSIESQIKATQKTDDKREASCLVLYTHQDHQKLTEKLSSRERT